MVAQLGVRERAVDERDLEREPGGGGQGVGARLQVVLAQCVAQGLLQLRTEPGLAAHREQRADLDAAGSERLGLAQLVRGAEGPGEPERQSERHELVGVGHVAGSVDRLPGLVEHELAARRCVVTACAGCLDDEPVGARHLVTGEVLREHVVGDDREEDRAAQRRKLGAEHLDRVDRGRPGLLRQRVDDVDRDRRRAVLGEPVEQLRDVSRDAGAHEHDVDTGEHRAVGAVRRRHLDLLEVVHADDAVVALLGEEDLDEVGDDGEPLRAQRRRERRPRGGEVGLALGPAALDEVVLEHLVGHRRHGERGEGAAQVAGGVAVLQAAREHDVEPGAGHHAQLAGAAHGARELPARDGHAHAALDDARKGADVHVLSWRSEGINLHLRYRRLSRAPSACDR